MTGYEMSFQHRCIDIPLSIRDEKGALQIGRDTTPLYVTPPDLTSTFDIGYSKLDIRFFKISPVLRTFLLL